MMVDPVRLRKIINERRETDTVEFKREDIYIAGKYNFFVQVAALINSGNTIEESRYIIIGVNDPQSGTKRRSETFVPIKDPKRIEARNQSLADTARAKLSEPVTIVYEEVEVPTFHFFVGVYEILPKRRPIFTKGEGPDRDPIIWIRRPGKPGKEKANPDEQCRLWAEYFSREKRELQTDLEKIEQIVKHSRTGARRVLQRLVPFLISESPIARERVARSLPEIVPDPSQWAPWLSGLALWDEDEGVRYVCARALSALLPLDRRFLEILTWMCFSTDERPGLRLDIIEKLEQQPGLNIETMRKVLEELASQTMDSEIAGIAQKKLASLPYVREEDS